MKPIVPSVCLALAVSAFALPATAADAAAVPLPAASAPREAAPPAPVIISSSARDQIKSDSQLTADAAADRGEPNVKLIIIDGDNSHIEELRVRGVPQRITVQPKIGPKKSYEIITGDGSRDLSPGVNTSRGAAGQRVWNVLTF
jgi:hypothetical protein